MSIITDVIESTRAIIQGMGVTLSYIPKQKWTVQYPEEPVTVQPRYRGQRFLCAAACPSDCIYIVARDDPRPPQERTGVDERFAEVYNIDYGRCIFCGYCVEACPKDAITHGYNFELSVYNRADLLKTKNDLLITRQLQSKNYRVAFSDEDVDSEYKEV
jgi:NADH-quinone oxidoreductase subunit I